MRRTGLALALALLAGCSLLVKTEDLEPLVDAQGFCNAFNSALVQHTEACEGWHPALGQYYFDRLAADCQALGRSEDAGRIRYDRASAEACLDAVEGAGCELHSIPEACELAVRGAVGPNGSCGSNGDCDPDTTRGCAFTGLTCPGTCAAPAQSGQPCGNGCDDGLVCDWATTGNCMAAPTEGQACLSFGCAEGLFCNATTVCQKVGRSGVPCTFDYECDDQFFCDTTRTPATCQPHPEDPLQTAVGARCDGPYDCASELWCDVSTTPPSCKARQSNVDCSATSAICKQPQICVSPSGGGTPTCQNPKAEGQACTGGISECQRGLTCDAANGAAGVCVPPGAIGDTCVTGGELRLCGEGWCDRFGTGLCQDYLALGATCFFADQCSIGGVDAYCYDDGSGPKCVASCQ